MKATVMKIAINLNNEGLLRAREASVLKEMVLRENPVLVAAFEVNKNLVVDVPKMLFDREFRQSVVE